MTTLLVVTGNPSTYAAGVWPEPTMNGGVWQFNVVTGGASGSGAYSGFCAIFDGPIVGGFSGGIWFVNDALELYDTNDNLVFSRAQTFSNAQNITYTLNVPAKTITISGATTGNGTFGFTLGGPYFFAGTTLTAGGVTGQSGFAFPGTIGNIVDLAPDGSWAPTYPPSRLRRALPSALLAAVVAPVVAPAAPPPAPELSWSPTFPDQVARRVPARQDAGGAPPIVVAAPAAPELSWSPVAPAQVSPRRQPQQLSAAAPVAAIPNPPAPELSWSPTFPDRAARSRQPQHLATSAPVDPPPVVAVTGLPWIPTFPDRAARPRQPQHVSVASPPFAGGRALTVGDAGIRQNILGALAFTGGSLTTFATDLTVTVNSGTDTLTAAGHGMVMCAGPFNLVSTGTQPGNTSPTTPYYVNVTGTDTFRIALTPAQARAGTVVDITSDGTGTVTLQRARSTAPLYSTFVAVFMRGDQGASPNQATDSFGNAYTYVSGFPRGYDSFPSSAASVAVRLSGRGGAAHTWSASIGNVGGQEDEVTIGGLEIFHAPILQASSVIEVANGAGATVTSGAVTTTARALLVAIIFGNGPVNQEHVWTFLDGFTKIPRASAEGDVDPAGYIQCAIATRLVEISGTYSFRAQGTNNEGGQLALLAFQAVTSDLSPLDWMQPLPAIPARRRSFPMPSGEFGPPLVGVAPAPELSWSPTFPDRAARRLAPPASVAADPLPQPEVSIGWLPVFPDHRAARARVTDHVVVGPVDQPDLTLGWLPIFPDRVVRTRSVVPGDGADSSATLPRAELVDWLPGFPDRIARARGAAHVDAAAPVAAIPNPPAPELSWSPTFPSTTSRQRAMLVMGGADAPVAAIPNPPAPELSWSPTFPDRVQDRSARLAVQVPDVGAALVAPSAPPQRVVPKAGRGAAGVVRGGVVKTGGVSRTGGIRVALPSPAGEWNPQWKDNVVDFDRDQFTRFIADKGYLVTWEKAVLCPNVPGTGLSPRDHVIGCKICDGTGFIYVDAARTMMLMQGIKLNQAYYAWGRWDMGNMLVTAEPEFTIDYFDRLTLGNGVGRFTQRLTRGAGSTDKLKYAPLCFHYVAWVDRSGDLAPFAQEVDFRVSADGSSIEWSEDSQPDAGSFYTVSYDYRPRYVVLDLVHHHRDSTVEGQHFQFPVQALAKLDYLIRNEGADARQIVDPNPFK